MPHAIWQRSRDDRLPGLVFMGRVAQEVRGKSRRGFCLRALIGQLRTEENFATVEAVFHNFTENSPQSIRFQQGTNFALTRMEY
jgi:hypothetical protein